MDENNELITGETRETPVLINGDWAFNPSIQIAREIFKLEKYDFYKLTSNDGPWLSLSQITAGATVGLLLNLTGKFIGSKIDQTIIFDKWECYAFLVALGATIICYLLYRFVPSEKKRIYQKIKNHFGNE